MTSAITHASPEGTATASVRELAQADGASRAAARTPPSMTMLRVALILLRVGTAGLFMAHALVRVMTPTAIPQFARFFGTIGVPQGESVVWAVTAFELGGGLLMALGYRTRYMAAGFSVILLVGIALIHRHRGWFVGEHGTGGSEYSVALLLALLVIASADISGADRQAAVRRDS